MTMLLILACLAAWALVALMLGDAGVVLRAALRGDVRQAWMPAPARRAASSRALIRA
ncbi:hypothetical protein [Sandarakinorhabdus cyanobacteriorum]|uniref:hypothetical protein n=1 Tax=Sandarakinorhabdus cyanobacteriorum TaxID=1981098 RepID=UPI0013FE1B00|nr:hypothetical protein [Sandarakinorhabdus cyanobacteriorum]